MRPPRHTDASLSRLVGPEGLTVFAQTGWGRRAFLVRGALQQQDLPIDIDGFEALLARLGDPNNGWLHIAQGSVRALPPSALGRDGLIDLRRLRSAFAQGQTLYLTKGERLDSGLAWWAEAIASDLARLDIALQKEVSAHLFLSPRKSQGFVTHRDEHASFVIQLEGSKDWTIYAPSPLDDERDGTGVPGGVAAETLAGRESEEFHLDAGDVLFMPEWWPHAARAGRTSSLHATFRLFPLNEGSRSDALRRQRLPPRPRAGRIFSQIGRLDEVTDDARLARTAEGACETVLEDGCAHLCFRGGVLTGPAAFAPVFAFVTEHDSFRVSDLPELDEADYDRSELARTMICEGLLSFAVPKA